TVQNGNFAAATGWTLAATSGCTATIATNTLFLTPLARGGVTSATQLVTVAGGDTAKEHALRIVVGVGPIVFRIGTSSGADDIFARTVLDTGTHSLAFTPNGNFYLQFEVASTQSATCQQRNVSTCQIESAGALVLPTPYAAANLADIR